jgi:pilus assembly protein Flp/PilA
MSVYDRMLELYVRMSMLLDEQRSRAAEGQGLVEYALIIAVVAIMLIAALVTLRSGISNTFNRISGNLNAGS